DERGKLAAREDVVPDREKLEIEPFEDALIEALVVATEEDQPLRPRQIAQPGLLEARSLGREDDLARGFEGRLPSREDGIDRGEDRLGLEDHAGTAAVRPIIDRAVPVRGEVANVGELEVEDARAARPTEDALLDDGLDHPGKDRQDVDM